jgi:Skp family chaperone for outer membrane proteins
MQRTFVIVLGLAACFGTRAQAQQGAPQPGQGAAPAQTLTYTKVGVVNMGYVYAKYTRVETFKKEMEHEIKPFKDKREYLENLIKQWETALKNPGALKPEEREKGPNIIITCRRQLEDLDIEFKSKFQKKLEEQMVILNNEINERIRQYSGSHGYHLIFAFGEPDSPLPGLNEFKRKMGVIDQGGVTVAYFAPGMDISVDLVQSLNSTYRPPVPAQPGQPVGTGSQPR